MEAKTTTMITQIVADLGEMDNPESLEINFNYVESEFFDSLFVLSLIAQIDQDFGIILTASEIFSAPTVSSLASLIEKKGVSE